MKILEQVYNIAFGGVSRKFFVGLVVLSAFAITYFNITDIEDIKILADNLLGKNTSINSAFVHGYKIGTTSALFFIDVILVGPFAYLSYYGEHIKPKSSNILKAFSFFDFGLALACIFTLWAISAHFVFINAVSNNQSILVDVIDNRILFWTLVAITAFWVLAVFLKVYSYSADQRKELSKYAIRF